MFEANAEIRFRFQCHHFQGGGGGGYTWHLLNTSNWHNTKRSTKEREREREKDEKALGHFTVSFQRPLLPFGHGRLSLVDHKRKENVGTRSNQQWKGVLRKRQKFNWPALFFLIFFFLSFFIFFIFFILALYWYFFNNYFSFFFANGGMLKVKVASMLPNVNKFVENSL